MLAVTILLFLFQPDPDLNSIRAFHLVDENLLTSGSILMEQYGMIRDYGVEHVITLLPGEHQEERNKVESMGMDFYVIPVNFAKPSLSNLKTFVRLMKSFGKDKVYVHCTANMRASAFAYLYRVTQGKADREKALEELETIWHPTNQWNTFIRKGLKAYDMNPDWRDFHPLVDMVRIHGIDSAMQVIQEGTYSDLPEEDLVNSALVMVDEEQDTLAALLLYTMALRLYPDNRETWYAFGRLQQDISGMSDDAIRTYQNLLQRFPDELFVKKHLGQLDVSPYQPYWTGVDYRGDTLSGFIGKWILPANFSFEVGYQDGHFTFKSQWMEHPVPLLRDPHGRYFVTRWPFMFTYGNSSGILTFTSMDGDIEAIKQFIP